MPTFPQLRDLLLGENIPRTAAIIISVLTLAAMTAAGFGFFSLGSIAWLVFSVWVMSTVAIFRKGRDAMQKTVDVISRRNS